MSFQEGHGPARGSRSRRARSPIADHQTILIRRAVAAGAGLLVLILLIVGIKGCLNSRKDRAYRNYAGDVRALLQSSDETSKSLFQVLSTPKNADALDVQTQVNAQRVDAKQLVQRAKGTDHPGELDSAQSWLVTALEFRAGAIARIADRLPTALGQKQRKPAIDAIAGQMQALLASDVIYLQRALPDLIAAYKERGILEQFPTIRFLPRLDWLDPGFVETELNKISGSAGKPATPGLHGTGLQGVAVAPSGTQLSDTGVNRVPTSKQLAFNVDVQNQGDSEEMDIGVTVTISDGKKIAVDQNIPRIAAGATATVTIPISQPPPVGSVSNVTIAVAPVPGEGTKDNNKATYQVVFTKS